MGLCASADIQEKVAYLLATPLFFHFDEEQLNDFAKIFTVEDIPAYHTLSKYGEIVDKLYVIGSGRVAFAVENGQELSSIDLMNVSRTKPSRGDNTYGRFSITNVSNTADNRILTTKQSGDFFGNVGIFKDEDVRQDHTVIALENLIVMWTTKEQLRNWTLQHPDLLDRLQEGLGDRIEASLRTMPLFYSVTDQNLRLVGSMVRYVTKNAGDVLFREGELSPGGNSLFIVYKGAANAVSMGANGKIDRVLNTFEAGQFFGEIGLMVDVPRTATIVCTEKTILLELAKRDFQNFLRLFEDESLHANMTELMKKRAAESFRKYKLPFFAAIPDDKYALLAKLCEIETLKEDVDVFCEGEVGSSFYLMLDGECKIVIMKHIKGEGRKEIELGRCGPGSYFGEQALIQGETRNATVRTVTRCVLVSISRANFKKFFDDVPEAMADFMVHLSKYNLSLSVLLNHQVGVKYFKSHLEKEYALENLEFYQFVNAFVRRFKNVPEKSIASELMTVSEDAEMKFRSKSLIVAGDGKKSTAENSIPDMSRDRSQTELYDANVTIEEAARDIVNTFIRPTGAKQVNIQFKTRDLVIKSVDDDEEYHADMFATALKEVTNLMETDSFPRFKQSQLFQEFLEVSERQRGVTVDQQQEELQQ